MKKYTFFIVAGLALFVFSCSKGTGSVKPNTNPGNGFFVKSETTVIKDSLGQSDSLVTNFYYDAQGRCNKIQLGSYINTPAVPLTVQETEAFVFGASTIGLTVTSVNNYTTGTITSKDTYYLNASGTLADSLLTVDGTGGTGTFEKYTYDANGYMITEDVYSVKGNVRTPDFEEKRTISNGDMTMAISHSYTGNYTDTTVIEYKTPNAPATFPSIISDYITTRGLKGKPNKDFESRATSRHLGIVSVLDFSYTFDSQGRDLQTVELSNGLLYQTTNLTYE